jgi:hypothetical protein
VLLRAEAAAESLVTMVEDASEHGGMEARPAWETTHGGSRLEAHTIV